MPAPNRSHAFMPVWHPASALPTAATLIAYFDSMGYTLEAIDEVHGPSNVVGSWRLHRPIADAPFKTFGSLASLWSWWRQTAAALMMAESRFRLLCALYRSASGAERDEMRACARDTSQDRTRRWRTVEPVGRWRPYTAEGLPPLWPAQVRDIELACLAPGELWCHQFLRFTERFDRWLDCSRLDEAIPTAIVPAAARRL